MNLASLDLVTMVTMGKAIIQLVVLIGAMMFAALACVIVVHVLGKIS